MDRVTKDGRALLDEAPKDTPCHYIDEGKGVRGYVPFTTAEIQVHQDWLASLPAKRERRDLAAAERRRAELTGLKAELADLPNGGALKSNSENQIAAPPARAP